MRRLASIVFKIALWGFIALWLAYTAAYFRFNDATLGAFITRKVSTVERGRFELERARFPYWGGPGVDRAQHRGPRRG